ncbi:hypothetical protein ASZ90_015668 [hydrocarbon metagenome]|uniref:Uncharacterized protein n=1 Tax=hydrocarbon metagenome TaxID=938273 RepID=A0A0W8F1A8_9ZZZZ
MQTRIVALNHPGACNIRRSLFSGIIGSSDRVKIARYLRSGGAIEGTIIYQNTRPL